MKKKRILNPLKKKNKMAQRIIRDFFTAILKCLQQVVHVDGGNVNILFPMLLLYSF